MIGIVLVGLLNMYTMLLQVECKNKIGNHIESYSELGNAIMGKWVKAFIDFCITVSQIGFCIAYVLFVGDHIEYVACHESNQSFCNKKNLYIAFSALFLIPICWLRTLKFISYVSFMANISIVFSCNNFSIYFYSDCDNWLQFQ